MLYSYWRSSCSWRVRIVLNLKGVDFKYEPVHLVADGGEQFSDTYRALNPLCQVPTLVVDDGQAITQSMAIIEYLDERYEGSAVFPKDLLSRAKVTAACFM